MEIAFTADANDQLTELELTGPQAVIDAVIRTLTLLEIDPGDPRLRTKSLKAPNPPFALWRITPCPPTDWVVIWELLDEKPPVVKVTAVAPL